MADKKIVAIYVGRFQPFHAGHYSVYKGLVDKFGKDNVYIGSSNNQDLQKSPFSFDEKKNIITTLFDVPSDKVQHVKSPYAPTEILSKFPDDTQFVTAVSEKDADRLGSRYFKPFSGTDSNSREGYKTSGYYLVVPEHMMSVDGENISSTAIRNGFRDPHKSAEEKVNLFKLLYGKFNRTMFKKMVGTLERTGKEAAKIAAQKAQQADLASKGSQVSPDDPQGAQASGIDPNAKVRNPETDRDILVKTALQYPKDHPAYIAARAMFKSGKFEEIFDGVMMETELVNSFNSKVTETLVGDNRDNCLIKPTDSSADIINKIKMARSHGIYHYALTHAMHINRLPNDGDYPVPDDDDMGKKQTKEVDKEPEREQLHDIIQEADSPTTRTRRFNRKHKDKVKEYLRKTAKDRAARNRDRRKAEKKHGKSYMADKDVHHPDGPNGGKTKVVKKDHGPDKKAKNEMISEGGAAGHMMHPYEDTSLTFAQYKDMIEKGLIGSLGDEQPVTEKLDGQNISFTVKDGDVRFARNKGHVKSRGENSLSQKDLQVMFKGRGDIERAFVGASRDLQSALEALGPDDVRDMFREGEKFMSVEIILPDTANVIPYGKSVLVFHGTIDYDPDGTAKAFNPDDGKVLADKIIEVGEHKQKMFGIQGPKTIAFSDKDTKKFSKFAKEFHSEIDRLASEFGLGDEDKVAKYYAKWWARELDKEAKQSNLQLTPEVRSALINRFAFDDKSIILSSIPDKNVKAWAAQYQKEKLKQARKVSQNPFELLFLRVGALSLQRVESFLAANSPGAIKEIKKELVAAMTSIKAEDQSRQAEKLQYEFDRLEKVGLDKIVPSEGLVFMYNGQPYKFTGTFAPINQLLGTFKFGGPAEPPESSGQPKQPEGPSSKKGFIKQFYGDKITNPETGRQITIQSALTYDPSHPARKQALSYLSTRI